MKPIHAIGDSHVMLFTGQDVLPPVYPEKSDDKLKEFKTYRLGPVLAYNLAEAGHPSREKLFFVVGKVPKQSKVMLCFGEIDCRAHVVKQAQLQSISILKAAAKVAERYFEVVKEVAALRETIVWCPTPQSASTHSSNKFPTVGTNEERNQATYYFIATLNALASREGIATADIYFKLVNRWVSDERYFFDSAHLSQKALPLALAALAPYMSNTPKD